MIENFGKFFECIMEKFQFLVEIYTPVWHTSDAMEVVSGETGNSQKMGCIISKRPYI